MNLRPFCSRKALWKTSEARKRSESSTWRTYTSSYDANASFSFNSCLGTIMCLTSVARRT